MTLLTFIEGAQSLSKTISPTSTAGYPLIKNLTSHTKKVGSIQEFHVELLAAATKGWALLKGPLKKPLFNESRAGHSDNSMPSDMLCLDFDNLQVPDLNAILSELGLLDYQHIIQYSASNKIKPGICAHVFFQMKPMSAVQLKRWLQFQNISCPSLRNLLEPNKSSTALKYALDIVTADNSRVLFIAPPKFIDGATDPMKDEQRIILVENDQLNNPLHPVVTLGIPPDAIALRQLLDAELSQLLPPELRSNGKLYHSNQNYEDDIVESTTQAQVTGVKDHPNSDFVYLNLNGGDSWGYYYSKASPDVLLNFKGEPPYLSQSIIPQHFHKDDVDKGIGVYVEMGSECYVLLASDGAHRKTKWESIASLARTLGIPASDRQLLPTLEMIYDPAIAPGFYPSNPKHKSPTPKYNTCVRPNIPRIKGLFPSIEAVLKHICVDEITYAKLCQWLASIFQTNKPARTAWIFTGTQGTGKGLFTNMILRTLVGERNLRTITVADLEQAFNGYANENIFLIYDEAKWSNIGSKSIDHALKTLVTSDTIMVNEKYMRSSPVANHNNLIICSNEHEPIRISHDDRRYFCAPRQEVSLKEGLGSRKLTNVIDSIYAEIPYFYDFLMSEPCDLELLNQTTYSEAKASLVAHNEWDMMSVTRALKSGNLLLFAQGCQPPDMSSSEGINQSRYNELILRFINEGMSTITMAELKVLYKAHCAKVQASYTNFKKQLLRSGLALDETVEHQGVFVEWKPLPKPPKQKPKGKK